MVGLVTRGNGCEGKAVATIGREAGKDRRLRVWEGCGLGEGYGMGVWTDCSMGAAARWHGFLAIFRYN
jgi:hypothetical protein